MLEADKRAVREMRRWCVRNQADRLGTLTYAPEHLPADTDEMWADLERFRKRLRAALGRHVPVMAVPELGGKNGRPHWQLAMGEWVEKRVLAEAWGKGFVDVRRLKVAGRGKRERARRAAAYCAKYVAKGHDPAKADEPKVPRGLNRRRYSVSKGFGVRRVSASVASPSAGIARAQELCGGSVVWSWSSAGDEDWLGPPTLCLHFGDP